MFKFLQTDVLKHFFTIQFMKFVIVGTVAAALHWLARFYLDTFMSFNMAVVLAYGVGMLVAFLLNAILVFPDSVRPMVKQCRDFTFINLAFFPVVWFLSLLFHKIFLGLGFTDLSDDIAHALAIPVPMLATFLFYKFFAFKA